MSHPFRSTGSLPLSMRRREQTALETSVAGKLPGRTTTIEIGLVGDAILGRRPLPDALTWHCASSLQTNDTGREERKFHCGLHKAIQGTRRLAARLDERRHQCALLDLSQTIPHCGFAYLSRTARPKRMKIVGLLPQIVHPTTMPYDANAQSSSYALKVAHQIIRRAASTAASAPARRSLGRPRYNGQHHQT